MSLPTVSREQVLRFRSRRHQLTGEHGRLPATDVHLLDLGVQDTGTDGALWALAVRGAEPSWDGLALAWTLRGAPHAYRRSDLAEVAVATAPWSEADAAKRVFDASKPLREAGTPVLEALRTTAGRMRDIVTEPMVKGELSTRLTEISEPELLRWCRPCNATHMYEQTFRLSALQAGLELEPGTSPPVLRRIPKLKPPLLRRLGDAADPRFDVVRGYLRFYGPARIRDVAGFVDTAIAEVKARLPDDAVEVQVEGLGRSGKPEPTYVLEADLAELARDGEVPSGAVRLLGPFDPYLQLRDRDILVEPSRTKELWPTLGRPGAIFVDGEVAGTWRPRSSGGALTLTLDPWRPLSKDERRRVEEEAERLAAFRGVKLRGVTDGAG